ncbi:hypothetical protein UlMin_043982 [Ulmus minor]
MNKFIKLLIVLVIFFPQFTINKGTASFHALESMPNGNQSMESSYKPVGPTEYRVMAANDGRRRRLAPFQLCLLCKCCSGATTCASMPCCFGIDCQLPNKPFGVCAFVPKTCNCTNCATSKN